MEEVQPLQIFVRNDKGKVWGPLMPASVELLIDSGVIDGRVQLSTDGYTDWNAVVVKASGSHTQYPDGISSANFQVSVVRTSLKL